MMPEVIHIVNGGGRVLCFGLAPVASLRCRTLRPGEVSINRAALTKNVRDQKSLLEGLKVG